MTLIDAHNHLGTGRVFGSVVDETQLVLAMDKHDVRASVVMPYPGDENPEATHDRIAALAALYPGRVFGIVNLNPHLGEKQYTAEATRCVQALGFVALKLHTIGHAVNPMSPDGELVFRTAAELGVAIMIHTGPGVPFALPSLCIPNALRYDEVPVVLAHAGHSIYASEALVTAQVCSNVFLETSWNFPMQIRSAVRELGPERVMMGTDGPANLPGILANHREALSDAELEHVLGNTAISVFELAERLK